MMDIKFVILEDMIPYDFEDCDKWGAVLFDIENKQIITSKYGHGVDMNERKNSVELDYAIEHNLVSIEEMIDIMINTLHINKIPDIEQYAANHSMENPICIHVKEVRERKNKSER